MENQTLTRRDAVFARRKRPTTITIPKGVSPHVRLVFLEMQRQGVTYDAVEEGSGVLRATVKAWRHRTYPSLMSAEAVLGFLGWDFVPVPRARVLPPSLIADLQVVADKHELPIEKAIESLIELVANVHERFPYRAPPRPQPIRHAQRKKQRAAPSIAPTATELAYPL